MTNAHEIACPRLKLDFSEQELIAIYSPTPAEIQYAGSQYRQVSQQTFLLICLYIVQWNLLQRLGYFVALTTVLLACASACATQDSDRAI